MDSDKFAGLIRKLRATGEMADAAVHDKFDSGRPSRFDTFHGEIKQHFQNILGEITDCPQGLTQEQLEALTTVRYLTGTTESGRVDVIAPFGGAMSGIADMPDDERKILLLLEGWAKPKVQGMVTGYEPVSIDRRKT